ncbi:uncharacterized protein RSE6_03749 [Rhynchosporium secalis]|uniref:Uncharacterized protein n=1 Tax=Rhynchosporium secalis TaxID=38038 RepID=A0A1E1M3J7_RHYSE|nr:uncharacterized protein RSE6_03749 [Rhynchosporium secalis]
MICYLGDQRVHYLSLANNKLLKLYEYYIDLPLNYFFLKLLIYRVYIQSAAIPPKSASKISTKAPKGPKITLKINTKSTATKSTKLTIDSVAATVPTIVLVLAIASQSTPPPLPESIIPSSSPPQIII